MTCSHPMPLECHNLRNLLGSFAGVQLGRFAGMDTVGASERQLSDGCQLSKSSTASAPKRQILDVDTLPKWAKRRQTVSVSVEPKFASRQDFLQSAQSSINKRKLCINNETWPRAKKTVGAHEMSLENIVKHHLKR